MKRAMVFMASMTLLAACSQAAGVGNTAQATDARPVATAGVVPAASPAPASGPSADATPATESVRDVTLPSGTILPVDLETSVGSDISRVEQPVEGRLRRALVRNGVEVLPAGTIVRGHVTSAQRPGKVKGRGYIAMRFTELDVPGPGVEKIRTATVSRLAPATKGKDAIEILAPAAGAAVVGRLVGGKKAAREGAVIGGAAGTGYVLSTRGKDVRLGKGANLSVKLTAPVTVKVRG
jgi:hypothetical protein